MELLDQIIAEILALPPWAGWAAIVLFTFVSEDLTCIAAGLVSASGDMPAAEALGATALGILLGDLLLYWAGHSIGRPALRKRPLSWVVHDVDVEQSARWFAQRGPAVILLGRCIPGSRLPTYFAAGLLGIGFWRFALYAAIAVALWAPLLWAAAYLMGRNVLPLVQAYKQWAVPAVLAMAFALVLVFKVILPSFTWRGRRMVVSRWMRLTRWEFWPPWAFYPPVVLYVLWLALRHRSLSLLTAVNPGLLAGGFVGESKAEILQHLGGDAEHVARSERIPAGIDPAESLARVRAFLARHALSYPVVLKPDAGQRGSGVAVMRSDAEARTYLERIRVDCLVQERVAGLEYGIFWFRQPREPRGHIFSITSKVFPVVRGDGKRTLEELILSDRRAVGLAKLYLDRNVSRLAWVPAAGEEVQLVEIGNHCRGAVFLDGTHLRTRVLEERIEAISRRFEGFYFGRYDVIAGSEEDLRQGRNFKVIELNGATSEATHIYDPRYGVLFAWRTLFEQWRILFSIAVENRSRGATTVRWTELLRMLSRYRLAARSHPT